MWEIAENLHRADLTVLERSDHVAEWAELSTKLSAERQAKENQKLAQVAQVSARGGRGRTGGVSAVARDLGLERTEVDRAIKLAGLPDEVKKAAKDAGLDDNQSALLKVAAEPSAEAQLKAIKEKKDRDEAQKQKLNSAEKEASRLKWEEEQEAKAKRIQNAGEFLVKP